jgi:hypothetical protein
MAIVDREDSSDELDMALGENGCHRIEIGDSGHGYLAICVVGWMHPGASDYWDGNWLISPIEVSIGGFRAAVPAGLRMEELVRFRESLEEVYSSLRGQAVLESMEGWLELRIAADRLGNLRATAVLLDRPGSANKLTFAIEGLDQSHLPAVVAALRAAEAKFPVRGPTPSH